MSNEQFVCIRIATCTYQHSCAYTVYKERTVTSQSFTSVLEPALKYQLKHFIICRIHQSTLTSAILLFLDGRRVAAPAKSAARFPSLTENDAMFFVGLRTANTRFRIIVPLPSQDRSGNRTICQQHSRCRCLNKAQGALPSTHVVQLLKILNCGWPAA